MHTNILEFQEKVFNILVDNGAGTAFTYNFQGEEYLITARHIVEKLGKKGIIHINRMCDSVPVHVEIHYPQNKEIDIAVLKYSGCLVERPLELAYKVDGLTITQEVYFLGFPFMQYTYTDAELKRNECRIPMVKKGMISGAHATKDMVKIFIDAHNNQGFSGGPVVVFDIYTNKPCICGVVSGYMPYEGNISIKGTADIVEGISYRENSGLMLAYGIDHALDVIKEI